MPYYMLSVWFDEPYDDVDLTSPDEQRKQVQVDEFNTELAAAGAWVFVTGLRPASTATVVRASGGDVSMTDGPYAESEEQMGGFWIVEAPDFDAALDWAAKGAAACEVPVEVWPADVAVRPAEDA
jgi:hypothetical protein